MSRDCKWSISVFEILQMPKHAPNHATLLLHSYLAHIKKSTFLLVGNNKKELYFFATEKMELDCALTVITPAVSQHHSVITVIIRLGQLRNRTSQSNKRTVRLIYSMEFKIPIRTSKHSNSSSSTLFV